MPHIWRMSRSLNVNYNLQELTQIPSVTYFWRFKICKGSTNTLKVLHSLPTFEVTIFFVIFLLNAPTSIVFVTYF
jgi:hypothetical protein